MVIVDAMGAGGAALACLLRDVVSYSPGSASVNSHDCLFPSDRRPSVSCMLKVGE